MRSDRARSLAKDEDQKSVSKKILNESKEPQMNFYHPPQSVRDSKPTFTNHRKLSHAFGKSTHKLSNHGSMDFNCLDINEIKELPCEDSAAKEVAKKKP